MVKWVQQDATIAFFIRNGFTLHVSGDNLTHHQEYNAVMATGELAHWKLTNSLCYNNIYEHNNQLYYISQDNSTLA